MSLTPAGVWLSEPDSLARLQAKSCKSCRCLGITLIRRGLSCSQTGSALTSRIVGQLMVPPWGRLRSICNEQLAQKMKIYAKDCALSDARQINGRSAAEKMPLTLSHACHLVSKHHPSVKCIEQPRKMSVLTCKQ